MSGAKLTVAGYIHFGARGLKGTEMYHLVRETWRKGNLEKVLTLSKKRCQYEFDLRLVKTLPGQARVIHALGQVKAKMWGAFPSRGLGEMVFDAFAASRLERRSGVLITTLGLPRTVRKAKELGYRVLLYGETPDPRFNLELIRSERQKLLLNDLRENVERKWMMARAVESMGLADYILSLSQFAKDTYVAHGFPHERIFITPLGVDLQKFRPSPFPADGPFTYLFMGHISGTTGILKGIRYLLQAWSELRLENARLLVCGKIGPEAGEVISRYEGKLRNVEFTGYVSNAMEFFRQASVFVFPSLAEAFGKVILEAMASGRPVITTPITEVVRDGIDGLYFPFRDTEALKEKMLHFYNHREDLVRMGGNAREQAERFSWEKFSRQIGDIVAEVSDNGSPAEAEEA